MIARREFIAGLGSAAAWPMTARAQQQTNPTVIWLDTRPGLAPPESVEEFRRGVAQVGFSEGRDVTISPRQREQRTTPGASSANKPWNEYRLLGGRIELTDQLRGAASTGPPSQRRAYKAGQTAGTLPRGCQ
jgi:hypothetical protein